MEIILQRIQLAPLVFYNAYDNRGFLLDLIHNRLIELNEDDTTILNALFHRSTLSEAIRHIHTTSPALDHLGEAEVLALVDHLSDQRLLETRPSPPPLAHLIHPLKGDATKPKTPTTSVHQATFRQRLTGAGHIISALNELRKGEEGLYRTHQYLQKLKDSWNTRGEQTSLSGEQLARREYWFYRLITGLVERRIAHLLGQTVGNEGLCLIRAVALCAYLLPLGIPATLVIARPRYGVSGGFKLHVWVEIEGRAFNETHTHQLKDRGPSPSISAGGVGWNWDAFCACSFDSLNACDVGCFGRQSQVSRCLPELRGENKLHRERPGPA